MQSPSQFRDVLTRVRAGDQAAAAELVRLYEPEVRRLIRVKLTDPNLRRVVDSADISQSVLGTFFVRVAAGQFDLGEPADLVRLLVTMARNKILDHARKPAARATRTADPAVWETVTAPGESPSAVVAGEELLAAARARLTGEELAIADMRKAGRGWNEIAAGAGVTPDAARKKLERALDRVCQELGLGRVGDE